MYYTYKGQQYKNDTQTLYEASVQHPGTNGKIDPTPSFTRRQLLLSELLQHYLNAKEYKGSNDCHYHGLHLSKCGIHS
jgi:hypothetical protein